MAEGQAGPGPEQTERTISQQPSRFNLEPLKGIFEESAWRPISESREERLDELDTLVQTSFRWNLGEESFSEVAPEEWEKIRKAYEKEDDESLEGEIKTNRWEIDQLLSGGRTFREKTGPIDPNNAAVT